MSSCTMGLVVALMSFIVSAAAATEPGPCAEEGCAAALCSSAYAYSAAEFPYTVDYTTTGDAESTTFVFKVCSLPCKAGDVLCQPLSSFQLRLADRLLISPGNFLHLQASLEPACSPAGPGLLFNSTLLTRLSTTDPAEGETCGVFSVSVLNGDTPSTDAMPPVPPQQLRLRDICQQNITLVDEHGQPIYDLASQAPACLFIAELKDGTSGFGIIADKTGDRIEAAFRVDSWINNTQLCSDYWQQSRRQYAATSPNAAYRIGLRAVLRSIAVELGDLPEPQVQSISTLCVSAEGSTDKLVRSTAVVSVPADIVDLYLEYLGDAVAGGSFREAVGGFGGPPAWLPTPMRYSSGDYEAVCLVGDANAACARTTWDPSTAEPLL